MENSTIKMMNQDFVCHWFNGTNFMRWKDKMKFMFTTLRISMFLIRIFYQFLHQRMMTLKHLKHIEKKGRKMKICVEDIFNPLSNELYDLHTMELSTPAIWNALKFKYKAEEEGAKKFLISKYFKYKFHDDMPILVQARELQIRVH